MVRVGGLQYTIDPDATMGKRITRHARSTASRSRPARPTRSRAGRRCPKSAQAASRSGTSSRAYLRDRKIDHAAQAERPTLVGVDGNPGLGAPA